MNRQYRPYQMLLTVLMALLSAACSTEKEPEVIPDVPVTPVTPVEPPVEDNTVDLLLSVSTTQQESTTRQSAEATQNDEKFRGIKESEMKLIPFNVTRAIAKDDVPMQQFSFSPTFVENSQYYYFATLKDIIIGTASFLCYGKAGNSVSPKAGAIITDAKFLNGSLSASFSDYYPRNITFSPVSIYTPDTKGAKIAEYLTAIVNAVGSENTTLFNEFTKYSAGTYQPFAGSSTNIVKLVNEWYSKVSSIPGVTSKILDGNYVSYTGTVVTDFIDAYKGHPTNLPDGAAIIRWNSTSNKFEYLTEPTTGSDINRLDKYAYPAELYYYGNSQIWTSTAHKESEYYSDPRKSWTEILGSYSAKKAVDATTRSIAVEDALEYGVACLKVQVRAGGNKLFQLDDNVGEPSVTLGDVIFPLTAVLVGGQHRQDFSFKPLYDDEEDTSYDDPTEDPEYLIYDKSIVDEGICLGKYQKSGPEDTGNYSDPLYTLVLQSKEGKPVKVVLEFLNNSGVDFKCNNGIVYRGTKFYLMAEVTLPVTPVHDYEKRVFTQDHLTTVQLTVSSLVNAYNALPNLSSDKLRVFETVQAFVKEWQTGDDQNKTIYNW